MNDDITDEQKDARQTARVAYGEAMRHAANAARLAGGRSAEPGYAADRADEARAWKHVAQIAALRMGPA